MVRERERKNLKASIFYFLCRYCISFSFQASLRRQTLCGPLAPLSVLQHTGMYVHVRGSLLELTCHQWGEFFCQIPMMLAFPKCWRAFVISITDDCVLSWHAAMSRGFRRERLVGICRLYITSTANTDKPNLAKHWNLKE